MTMGLTIAPADLALHRLHAVRADRAATPHRNLRLYRHAAGVGVFAAAQRIDDKRSARHAAQRVGARDGDDGQFFAIATVKKMLHPLVPRLPPGPG